MNHADVGDWLWLGLRAGVPLGLLLLGVVQLVLSPRLWSTVLMSALLGLSMALLVTAADVNWETVRPYRTGWLPALFLGLAIDIVAIAALAFGPLVGVLTGTAPRRGREKTWMKVLVAVPFVTAVAHILTWSVLIAH